MKKTEQPRLGAKFDIELATAGLMNREHETRIEAERVTIQFREALTPTAPQRSIKSLPLFEDGSETQQEMF